jgi:serine/threonine protein phosphatase PrpC
MLAAGSVQGPYRDGNEDRVAVAEIRFADGHFPYLRVGIVCDGMGGMESGDVAASTAVSCFLAALACERRATLPDLLELAADRANRAVYSQFNGRAGTTLSAIVLARSASWIVHVGDSRIYKLASDGELNLATVDDTIQGAINAHQGDKNEDELDNRLLQFIGVGESLQPHIINVTDSDAIVWLVTSDGAHGIGRRLLDDLVERPIIPSDLVRRFIFVADALNVKDNASVAAIAADIRSEMSTPSTGVDITLWSASDQLNAWLALDKPRDQVLKAQKGPEEIDRHVEMAPAKPRQRKKTRSKRSISRSSQPPETPPMAVIFEQGSAEDD